MKLPYGMKCNAIVCRSYTQRTSKYLPAHLCFIERQQWVDCFSLPYWGD